MSQMIISEKNTRILQIILLVVALLAPQLRAEYQWPLPASKELTSSFCAFRGGHYHAGIDIRTFGKTGYNVVAVDDGYLWRVSSNWWGYGNAAYLMLDDGNIAVYGHLQEFSPAVEKYVRQTQKESGRFKVNLFPEKDRFRFKKGDLIGKSGQSGSGAPHLHFEIRNGDNMPVDPYPYYPWLKDGLRPRFEEVTFRPLDAESFVDGSADPLSEDLKYNKSENNYIMNKVPLIEGKVGVEVKVADMRNNVSRKYNVAGLKFYLNDTLVFETTYDTLNFDSWNTVDLDYNHYQRIYNKSDYHNLYYPEGRRSSRQNPDNKCTSCSGTPVDNDLPPGLYDAKISAVDFNGNERFADLKIRIVPKIKFGYMVSTLAKPASAQSGPLESNYFSSSTWNGLTARAEVFDPLSGKFGDGNVIDLSSVIPNGKSGVSLKVIYTRIDDKSGVYKLARIDFLQENRIISSWLLGIGMNPDRRFLDSSLTHNVDFIDYVEFISSQPHVKINLQKLYSFLADNNFRANFAERIETGENIAMPLKLQKPLKEYAYGEGFSPLVNYLAIENLLENGYFLYQKGDKSELALNNLRIDFSPDLPANVFFNYKAKNSADGAYVEEISLIPDDKLLIEGINIRFMPPPSYSFEKSAIFGISRDGKQSFLGRDVDDSGYISATARSLGTYRLMADTIPPVIRKLYPGNGTTVKSSRPSIHFFMDDELAGFNSDTLLIVTIDGDQKVSYYDVDNKIARIYLLENLKPGKHALKITARDLLGNTTIKESSFFYNPAPKK